MLSRYVVIETPEEPKVATISVESTAPIPAGLGNSPSSSFFVFSFSSFLLPFPLIFFISLPEAYVIFILGSIAY